MPIRRLLLVLAAAVAAHATTVQPPTFPELVGEADGIYRGRVVSVQARRVALADGGSIIKTFITFDVQSVLKGSARENVVLEFLGGTIGDETLEIGGVPHFNVGDREFIFVQKNGVQFCPLVRLGHGRYRVERDPSSQLEFIARDNRAPLTDPSEVALPLAHGPAAVAARAASARSSADALTPASFEAHIRGEVRRTHAADKLP